MSEYVRRILENMKIDQSITHSEEIIGWIDGKRGERSRSALIGAILLKVRSLDEEFNEAEET